MKIINIIVSSNHRDDQGYCDRCDWWTYGHTCEKCHNTILRAIAMDKNVLRNPRGGDGVLRFVKDDRV